jgi:hypothetical protein
VELREDEGLVGRSSGRVGVAGRRMGGNGRSEGEGFSEFAQELVCVAARCMVCGVASGAQQSALAEKNLRGVGEVAGGGNSVVG